MRARTTLPLLLALLLGCSLLAGCSRPDPVMVALMFGGGEAQRWERIDEPAFRDRVRETCRGCQVRTFDAGGDADRQAEQFAEALDAGADVVVLAAVAAERAEGLVAGTEVPVVAYDRFVAGADYHVGHDVAAVGTLQARSLVRELGGRGRVLLVNGGRADPNAAVLERAVRRVLEPTDIEVVAQLDPPDWSAAPVRQWVAARLAEPGRIDGIYAANDTQAGAVVRALHGAGIPTRDFPVVTGQDAELGAVRRLLTGEQAMTVHKRVRAQAERAADIAVAVMTDEPVTGGENHEGVRSWIFEPRVVTTATLTDTVVRNGLYTIPEICTKRVERRCRRLGIS